MAIVEPDPLERLRILTRQLPPVPVGTIIAPVMDGLSVVLVPQGAGTLAPLASLLPEAMSIIVATLEPKTLVPPHQHEQMEVVIIISGHCRVTVEGKTHTLGYTDSLRLPPNVPHSVETDGPCVLVCITVPANKDYVHG
jgi:quercetin dioxygenase-like cupin family protein